MRSSGIIPIEQGATAGKTAIDSSMMKQMFMDQVNVLHQMCAISSTDTANCYNTVNHTAASLLLQTMRVPIAMVKCYLLCVQKMHFFLKTGYGVAAETYGGTVENPYMGLMQGSGAPPVAWIAISTIMISAYKNQGYWAHFALAWSRLVFVIAALLYVDDTDLLHLCHDHSLSETESSIKYNWPCHTGLDYFKPWEEISSSLQVTGIC